MRYYCILQLDTFQDKDEGIEPIYSIRDIKPDVVRRTSVWTITEDQPDDDFIKQHRKYTGVLTYKDFMEFVYEYSPSYSNDTLGSLTEYGWLPAISLQAEFFENAERSVYVSPLPDEEVFELLEKRDDEQARMFWDICIEPRLDRAMEILKSLDFRKLKDLEADIGPDADQIFMEVEEEEANG